MAVLLRGPARPDRVRARPNGRALEAYPLAGRPIAGSHHGWDPWSGPGTGPRLQVVGGRQTTHHRPRAPGALGPRTERFGPYGRTDDGGRRLTASCERPGRLARAIGAGQAGER